MKRILVLIALVASVQLANAQKSADAIKKAVTSAQAACNDEKKAAKPATWLGLAKAATEAYTAPQLNGWAGAGRQELQMVMSGIKPVSTEEVVLNGTAYSVDVYPSCKYYYNEAGVLQIIEVTTPYVEDALAIAVNAYENAAKVDPKATKTKDICAGLEKVAEYYQNDAYTAYTLGDLNKASQYFQKSADASMTSPLCKLDTAAIYNSGLTAFMAGNLAVAKAKMEECIKYGYYEKGEAFAKLAECEKAQGDTVKCKVVLEEGFAKCPDNQGILVGLINLYLDTNDDPEKLFKLLDIAKVNEPNNASLYYVEGNIRKQLGQKDEALAAYAKCAEVNPEYEFGYVASGLLYWDEAVKIQEEAEKEFNDRKYQALVEKFDAALQNAIPCFETAFNVSKDKGVRVSLADYLKNIFFRFRDKGDEYQANYEKYNNFVKENQ